MQRLNLANRFALIGFTTMALLFSAVPAHAATNIADRLKGRFLLDVDHGGKIWYVSPLDKKRYEIDSQATLGLIIWSLAFGPRDKTVDVTTSDVQKIPTVAQKSDANLALRKKYAGFFLWEQKSGTKPGEIDFGANFDFATGKSQSTGSIKMIWYINPGDLKRHYYDNSVGSFNYLKRLALGIKYADLKQIPIGSIHADSAPETVFGAGGDKQPAKDVVPQDSSDAIGFSFPSDSIEVNAPVDSYTYKVTNAYDSAGVYVTVSASREGAPSTATSRFYSPGTGSFTQSITPYTFNSGGGFMANARSSFTEPGTYGFLVNVYSCAQIKSSLGKDCNAVFHDGDSIDRVTPILTADKNLTVTAEH